MGMMTTVTAAGIIRCPVPAATSTRGLISTVPARTPTCNRASIPATPTRARTAASSSRTQRRSRADTSRAHPTTIRTHRIVTVASLIFPITIRLLYHITGIYGYSSYQAGGSYGSYVGSYGPGEVASYNVSDIETHTDGAYGTVKLPERFRNDIGGRILPHRLLVSFR